MNIVNDLRPIQSVVTLSDGWWCVGRGKVTKIVSYLEKEAAWFAIYKGDTLAYRVHCAAVEYTGYEVSNVILDV